MRFTALYPMHQTPYSADILEPDFLRDFARTAERCGFDAVTLTEHPAPSARWLGAGGHDALDVFTTLGFFAAVTSTIRLMPYVLVPPFRNPVMAAKQIATLDVLSGGRLTVPVGTGYLRSEASALGTNFDDRNDLLDAAVAAWVQLWSGHSVSVSGDGYRAEGILQRPRPVQEPHPPIWVGGNSRRARQRVAEYGQGWTPILADEVGARTTRTAPLPDTPALAAAIVDMKRRVEEAGRDPSTISVQVQQLRGPTRGAEMEGDFEPYLEWLHEMDGVGVTQVLVHVPVSSGTAGIEALERYSAEVIARYR
jgi:probable F420-dependent oxidoreductase